MFCKKLLLEVACFSIVDGSGRVSVMRGQVITPQGLGIVGIRVSVDRDSRFGFTLTRQGGW
uniref:Teneurin TTR-like domain-containing protein n=1 Tax=Megaselia scalaris TaxID=36166 RepID=T1GKX9_MEGSC